MNLHLSFSVCVPLARSTIPVKRSLNIRPLLFPPNAKYRCYGQERIRISVNYYLKLLALTYSLFVSSWTGKNNRQEICVTQMHTKNFLDNILFMIPWTGKDNRQEMSVFTHPTVQAPIIGWFQKHRGKPLNFHDKCPGFFYVHHITHGTYSFTFHPKDGKVSCSRTQALRPARPGFEPTFWQHQNLSPMH